MEVVGIIMGEIQKRTAPTSGKPYYSLRLLERNGPRERKAVTWYDCYAHVPDEVMQQIKSRDLVRIRGKVEAVAFKMGDGEVNARLRLVCHHIEVVETYEVHLERVAALQQGASKSTAETDPTEY